MEVKGCDIVDRLDSVLLEQNMKRSALADICGFSAANISRWKHLNSIPAADVLYNVSLCIGVSFEWLLTGIEKPNTTTRQQYNLINKWERLTDEDKEALTAFIDAKLEVKKNELAG
ncbi:MAG: hypothetical protein Ta2B_13880 [Termitinemataceae bacterium]|nr:MAG: hypothetical protein Ta2B_13880 [Termitinemataceae bacterium]